MICYYCRNCTANDESAFLVKMSRRLTTERPTQGWYNPNSPPPVLPPAGQNYEERVSIRVPRCASCQKLHNDHISGTQAAGCGGCLVGVVPAVLVIGAYLKAYPIEVVQKWHLAAITLVFLVLTGLIAGAAIAMFGPKWRHANIKMHDDLSAYEPVNKLKLDGWSMSS
jgi:hypothetical protein